MTDRLEALNSMGWAIDVRLRPPGVGLERYRIEATRFDGEILSRYTATGKSLNEAELRHLTAMRVGAGVEARVTEALRVSA